MNKLPPVSEHRLAGRQDCADGRPLASPPEKVFIFGRERKTRMLNEANADAYREYLAGYQEGPGVSNE